MYRLGEMKLPETPEDPKFLRTPEAIIERHKVLHRSLDELFACYITQHPDGSQFLETPIGDMMEWSFEMTQNPTCVDKHIDPNEVEDDETEATD